MRESQEATSNLIHSWGYGFPSTVPPAEGFGSQSDHLFAQVGDMPNGARSVICDEHAAVVRDGDTDRSTPDLAILGDEPGEEVLVTAIGMAVVHGDANDFVACTAGAVPGAVLGGECVAIILSWELAGRRIESHLKRRHVGLNENVGSDHL